MAEHVVGERLHEQDLDCGGKEGGDGQEEDITGVKSFGFRVGRIRASFRKVKHYDVVFAAMAGSWSLEKFEEKR
jgi:hypothetical protein